MKIATLSLVASCGSPEQQALSIAVTPGAIGAAELSWVIPTERVDDTPLLNLAGFTLYYGIAPGLYTEEIVVDNPSINTYLIQNLDSDSTFYFAMTAYDANGIESAFSNEVSKTID